MRDRDSWSKRTESELLNHLSGLSPEGEGLKATVLCEVELALRLLERICPKEPAGSAYTLLSGYRFAAARGLARGPADRTALAAARHLLPGLRRRRSWHQSLDAYHRLPERLRAYDVPDLDAPARRLSPTVATDRMADYDTALAALPPFAVKDLPVAPAGRSTFVENRRPTSVTIPAELVFPPAPGHNLAAGRHGDGTAITITRQDLAETAAWMDAEEEKLDAPRGHWQGRLDQVRFAIRPTDRGAFTEGDSLTLDGLLHLVGMVGAGKSTLMLLTAIWAARRGLRTTLVVGDVAEQLRIVKTLRVFEEELGESLVMPVLGSSTREIHVQRLHRRLAARGLTNLLDHDDEGFDDLGTTCAVDALRGTEAAQPLRYADAPCVNLHPRREPSKPRPDALLPYTGDRLDRASREPRSSLDEVSGPPYSCPLWGVCPRHRAARGLVHALIWVANPASLVQSAVPRPLNQERIRYLELACLMSDIVIVDEADSVQMTLDGIFAPSATLVEPGPDSWLDELHTHKITELSRRGRLPLTDREIERWNSALTTVSAATDRLYGPLISDKALRTWVDIEYFSPWTLQEKLLADWFGLPEPGSDEPADSELYEDDEPEERREAELAEEREDPHRTALSAALDAFRDDPLGEHGPHGKVTEQLIAVASDLLNALSRLDVRPRVKALLDTLTVDTPAPVEDRNWCDITCRRLEFLLLLTVLDHRLERLTFLWPVVEAALRLDPSGNELGHRPPLDYAPFVPESPMGNVLGYQFLPDESERDEDGQCSGTLRFFRCAGVGRELLLSLNTFGIKPDAPGPHVVLMSGTSWAGASSRAHVLAPVRAILMPSERSLTAVAGTRFVTRFQYTDEGRPISISGSSQKVRPSLMNLLVERLAGPGRGGLASQLDQELAKVADESRRRAILLVGSYREAAAVAEIMHRMERWRGKVRVLAADDAELGPPEREPLSVLRRGDLATFAEDLTAEVLVAPLMAVERGHNILNSERNAAFGVALFLVRPHPRPDDLSLAVFAINDWVGRFIRDQPRDDDRDGPKTFTELVAGTVTLEQASLRFRQVARQEWRRLLTRRYIHSRLPDWEKKVFAWDQLVTIWQVIGRLVRGGVPARVVFVDARFAPRLAAATAPGVTVHGGAVAEPDGLLAALRDILIAPDDPELAHLLYEPLFNAITNLSVSS
ncbi:hypothetical protein ACFY19_17760 [Streptosporangium saharense]|uniref:pPIWI_RE_Z domain-containing protein n=1 Tax=Streptosporangium saharense TaxID=1706840 RepID=UPI00369F6496